MPVIDLSIIDETFYTLLNTIKNGYFRLEDYAYWLMSIFLAFHLLKAGTLVITTGPGTGCRA